MYFHVVIPPEGGYPRRREQFAERFNEGLKRPALDRFVFPAWGELDGPAAVISDVVRRCRVVVVFRGYLRECKVLAPTLGGYGGRVCALIECVGVCSCLGLVGSRLCGPSRCRPSPFALVRMAKQDCPGPLGSER